MLEAVIDRAHKIDTDYTDKKTQKVCKSIIVHFYDLPPSYNILQSSKVFRKKSTDWTTFLDLTKRQYDILKA